MEKCVKLLCVLSMMGCCQSANVLFVEPFTSTSHHLMLRPIGLELAQRGHNVTVITSHNETKHPPNFHQVMVDNKKIWEVLGGERPNIFTMINMIAEEFHNKILWVGGVGVTELAFNSSDVKEFLKKENTFDVVISEQFYQEATYALAHKYNAPLVLVTTFGNCMRHNILTRNPLQLATVNSEFLEIETPTSFWARLRNLYFTVYEYIWWRFWYLEKHEALVRKYLPDLPKPVPSLYELQRNASLTLLNSHFSFDVPAAYLPNIVEVGGLHLSRSNDKLPQDLQKVLDEAKHGVVYVNFGTNIRSSEMPLEKKKAFINVFKGLKQIVLWKWEDDILEDKPSNLVNRKWFPQKEILAHPNIKVFISHGGLIGTQEAMFNGVPVIGVPVYADQYNNLLQIQELGFGRILQFHDINEECLNRTLNEFLNNDSYKDKAKEASARFKDRPMTALETAMFWIEYVIRHKGADYMKNPARELSWMAYNMLDVYIFILCLVLGTLYIVMNFFNILRRNINVDIKVRNIKKVQ